MKKISLFVSLVVLALYSCQNDLVEIDGGNLSASNNLSVETYQSEVSSDEAKAIAVSFQTGSATTRAQKEISEMLTINGEDGKLAFYVINFSNEGGFVLVSATKNYQHVLAYADAGHFDPQAPTGVQEWMANMKLAIDRARTLPVDSVATSRALWNNYLSTPKSIPAANGDYDAEATEYMMQKVREWESQGYTIMDLSACSGLPFYETFRAQAEASTLPVYDYMRYTIVLKRVNDMSELIDDFVGTKWAQGSGFNTAFDKIGDQYPVAGCTTIATAQIMWYHRYPIYFAWDDMPALWATPTTAAFIRDVAEEIGVDLGIEGSPANINDVKAALNDPYGYRSRIIESNLQAEFIPEMREKMPIYMRGSQHAWMVSGMHNFLSNTEYQLQVMTGWNSYSNVNTQTETSQSLLFYMNWGWGGNSNGYYTIENAMGYTDDQKALIGIRHS